MWTADSLEKTLMLEKIGGKRKKGQQRMSWLDGIINSMEMNLSKLREIVEDRGDWHAVVHGIAKSQIWLSSNNKLLEPGWGEAKGMCILSSSSRKSLQFIAKRDTSHHPFPACTEQKVWRRWDLHNGRLAPLQHLNPTQSFPKMLFHRRTSAGHTA